MNKEYISVKEYAEIKGISTQAVYKQLSTKLATYVVKVGNHKMLKIQVLDDEITNQVDNQVTNQVGNFSTPKNCAPSPSAENDEELKRINRRNENIIDELRAQLKEKDKQIENQTNQIVDLSNKIAELFENNQKLQLNYQMLLGESKDNINTIVEVDDEGALAQNEVKQETEKRGLFKRIFNK